MYLVEGNTVWFWSAGFKPADLDLHFFWNRIYSDTAWQGLWVIKLFLRSSQLSTKFILLINVKMPRIVGILTFISRIKTTSESFQARHVSYFSAFWFLWAVQISLSAELSMEKFHNLGTWANTRPPDKSARLKIIFFISQPKHLLWVLKRTVSMRRFFWAPKTHV